jgi:hypothetical protein
MMWGPGGWWIPFLLIGLFFWGPWRWGRRMRRWERGRYGPWQDRPRSAELDESVKARLDLVDQLETRVSELENRLDFTERLLAERREEKAVSS